MLNTGFVHADPHEGALLCTVRTARHRERIFMFLQSGIFKKKCFLLWLANSRSQPHSFFQSHPFLEEMCRGFEQMTKIRDF